MGGPQKFMKPSLPGRIHCVIHPGQGELKARGVLSYIYEYRRP
jgi:hypothetical protein